MQELRKWLCYCFAYTNTYITSHLDPSWTLDTCVVNGFGEVGGGVAGSCPQLLSPTSYFSDEAVCLIQVQIDSENREVKTSGKPGSQKPVLTPISVTLQEINLNIREA